MEFLVQIETMAHQPTDEAFLADLGARERQRGVELVEAGSIRQIWRIPGRRANIGIWEASDTTELHAAISSLPAFPWMDVTVTPLARHPLGE
jgi:muconolactone D-isomerase